MPVMISRAGHIHRGARTAHMPAWKVSRRIAAAPARTFSRLRPKRSRAMRLGGEGEGESAVSVIVLQSRVRAGPGSHVTRRDGWVRRGVGGLGKAAGEVCVTISPAGARWPVREILGHSPGSPTRVVGYKQCLSENGAERVPQPRIPSE